MLTGSSIHAISVSDAVADELVAGGPDSLAALQTKLDGGEPLQRLHYPR